MPPRVKHVASKRVTRSRGESSARQEQAPEFDDFRFISKDREQWYNRRRENKFVVEKTIDPRVDSELHITDAFRVLGWQGVLELRGGFYYPELVRQFYANMTMNEREPWEVNSMVKGVNVCISTSLIARYLGCPTEGIIPDTWHSQSNYEYSWSKDGALERFGTHTEISHGRQLILAKRFDVRPRLFVYLISFNVEPKISGVNELRVFDLYLIDKVFNGMGDTRSIQLAPTILKSIWEVQKHKTQNRTFVFPVLITQLLMRAGVDVANEMIRQTTERDVVNLKTLSTLKFKKVGGIWINTLRAEGPEEAEEEEDIDQQEEAAAAAEEEEHGDPRVISRLDRMEESLGQLHESMGQMNERMSSMDSSMIQMQEMMQTLLSYHQYPPPPPM